MPRAMAFWFVRGGHFEVTYQTVEDMAPEGQAALLKALEAELPKHPVSILFLVERIAVPRSVPEFWLTVTSKHAPRLCAMAIVSESMAVRAAANFFAVANTVRRVKVSVQAFPPAERQRAELWCSEERSRLGADRVA
jgi:hypothetical protein